MEQPMNKNRRSLRDLRTAATSRVRAKPSTDSQRYLDLYVLQRDRLRWGRMKQQAEQMILAIDKALTSIGFGTAVEGDKALPEGGPARTITITARRNRTAA